MKPKIKEKANAKRHTKINCCQVNLIDFKILYRSSILAKTKLSEKE
jgi:hypothetical protein